MTPTFLEIHFWMCCTVVKEHLKGHKMKWKKRLIRGQKHGTCYLRQDSRKRGLFTKHSVTLGLTFSIVVMKLRIVFVEAPTILQLSISLTSKRLLFQGAACGNPIYEGHWRVSMGPHVQRRKYLSFYIAKKNWFSYFLLHRKGLASSSCIFQHSRWGSSGR